MTPAVEPKTTGAAPRPVTIFLVRHGVASGAEGRCIGQSDLALSPRGRADIGRLADSWPEPRPARVIASDLARTRDSAAVLASHWNGSVDVSVDRRLREMDFGQWDGRHWSDIRRDDADRLGHWMERWEEARVPGGEGFGDVIDRAAGWLAAAVGDAADGGFEEQVVVAHAGSIRSLLVHALGLPRAVAFRLRLDHARVSALRISGEITPAGCAAAELLFLNCATVVLP